MWVAQIPRPPVPLPVLHQMLYGYFDDCPEGERPFIFRLERGSLILASSRKPLCSAAEVKPEMGKVYQFDAILKPMNGGGRNPIEGNDARREWIGRNVRGAEVKFCQIQDMPDLRFRRDGGRTVVVPLCRAVGTVQVTDPEVFDAFLSGGGPGTAKAYGCGLWVLPELMGVQVGARHPFQGR